MNAIIEAILERAVIYINVMAAVASGEITRQTADEVLSAMEAHDGTPIR